MTKIDIEKLRFDVLMLKSKHTIRSELGLTRDVFNNILKKNNIKYSRNESRLYVLKQLHSGVNYNDIPIPNELIIKLILGYNGKVEDLPQLERVKYIFSLGYNYIEISNVLKIHELKVKTIIKKYILWQK